MIKINTIIYAFFLCIVANIYCNGQEILTEKVSGGYKFSQNGKELSLRNFADIV